ncbi:type II toxin-antitoxin system RelE/ParE family toxin [Niveispirillum sp. KHB5.9]|uniref:type II toxin-antitoxin system RelE/ParE family toxin n=1 Tax=Niveispirillum sp. KHB5.9 TaxID=3400269 RepID=UPI003A8C6121
MSLSEGDRRIIGQDIATVEFGWPVGMPVCRSLGQGIWEIRSTVSAGRVEARLYFAAWEGNAVLLHGHTGKDLQQRAIAVARERLADFMARKGKPA